MTTGTTMSPPAVFALNSLQKPMMLTPCWPSAGPTGGAGLALPAWIWSLTTARTFLAMLYVLCPARVRDTRAPSPIHARGGVLWDDSSLQALHLEQVQLD